MTNAQQTLFAFGLGYVAERLARDLISRGWRVVGTTTRPAKAGALHDLGIEPVVFAGKGDLAPPAGAHWLISIPPGEAGCPAWSAARGGARGAASITYLSTTGVYGDLGGGWAFEWTPVHPASERSRRRVLAEEQWGPLGGRIVRLPGIYGPGRSPFERIRRGEARAIVKTGQVFSRCHVDDIAAGLAALLARPTLGGVFHLCDDSPAPPHEVTLWAAERIGAPRPPEEPFETADLSPMARSFYAECKRVSNARAKAALGWRPRYPSYREGLDAVLAEEG